MFNEYKAKGRDENTICSKEFVKVSYNIKAKSHLTRYIEEEKMGSETFLPKVTVIIPCYNRGKFIRETLDSTLSQTYRDLEIVAFDD